MKLVVVGLGSELLGDDAAGLKVVDILKGSFSNKCVDFKKCYSTGFEIMENIEGYDTAIIIDSICTGRHKKGEIVKINPEEIRYSTRIASFHDFDLLSSVELGKRLNLKMPPTIMIYGIEIEETTDFSDGLSPEIKETVSELAIQIRQDIKRFIMNTSTQMEEL